MWIFLWLGWRRWWLRWKRVQLRSRGCTLRRWSLRWQQWLERCRRNQKKGGWRTWGSNCKENVRQRNPISRILSPSSIGTIKSSETNSFMTIKIRNLLKISIQSGLKSLNPRIFSQREVGRPKDRPHYSRRSWSGSRTRSGIKKRSSKSWRVIRTIVRA